MMSSLPLIRLGSRATGLLDEAKSDEERAEVYLKAVDKHADETKFAHAAEHERQWEQMFAACKDVPFGSFAAIRSPSSF